MHKKKKFLSWLAVGLVTTVPALALNMVGGVELHRPIYLSVVLFVLSSSCVLFLEEWAPIRRTRSVLPAVLSWLAVGIASAIFIDVALEIATKYHCGEHDFRFLSLLAIVVLPASLVGFIASVILVKRRLWFAIVHLVFLALLAALGFFAWASLLGMGQSGMLPPAERDAVIKNEKIDALLFFAAANGDLACITQLLDAGADINTDIKNSIAAISGLNADFVKVLVAENSTPLLAAIKGRHVEAVKVLIARKADANRLTRDLPSALQEAAFTAQLTPQLDIVRVLVAAGADVNLKGERLGSPLVAAVNSHDLSVIRYLVEHGAKTNEPGAHGPLFAALSSTKEIVEYLLAQGADVNATNRQRRTALMEIASRVSVTPEESAKNLEILRTLIAAGANVNLVTEDYEDCHTALSLVQQSDVRLSQQPYKSEVERLLRQHGADASLVERCRKERAQFKEKKAAEVAAADQAAGIIRVDKSNFDRIVLRSAQPVLVYFWLGTCDPCVQMDPFIARVAGKYKGNLLIARLDVDVDSNVLEKYRIGAIPTLMLFRHGKVVDSLTGAKGETDTVNWLEQQLR